MKVLHKCKKSGCKKRFKLLFNVERVWCTGHSKRVSLNAFASELELQTIEHSFSVHKEEVVKSPVYAYLNVIDCFKYEKHKWKRGRLR